MGEHWHGAPARASLVEADGATGVLATIAFLVVFRVLIRDFFWMVTLVSFDILRRSELRRALAKCKRCTKLPRIGDRPCALILRSLAGEPSFLARAPTSEKLIMVNN